MKLNVKDNRNMQLVDSIYVMVGFDFEFAKDLFWYSNYKVLY